MNLYFIVGTVMNTFFCFMQSKFNLNIKHVDCVLSNAIIICDLLTGSDAVVTMNSRVWLQTRTATNNYLIIKSLCL